MSGLHIQRFVDRLRHFENKNAKEFSCSINDARDLHADITKLLLDLETLRELAIATKVDSILTVEVKGDDF